MTLAVVVMVAVLTVPPAQMEWGHVLLVLLEAQWILLMTNVLVGPSARMFYFELKWHKNCIEVICSSFGPYGADVNLIIHSVTRKLSHYQVTKMENSINHKDENIVYMQSLFVCVYLHDCSLLFLLTLKVPVMAIDALRYFETG